MDYKGRQKFLKLCDGIKCNGITKSDKFGLEIATGLQSATDYKVIQYNGKGYLTHNDTATKIKKYYKERIALNWIVNGKNEHLKNMALF